jgi:hypothetical protein
MEKKPKNKPIQSIVVIKKYFKKSNFISRYSSSPLVLLINELLNKKNIIIVNNREKYTPLL